MTKKICSWETCICCGRRADGLAVGTATKFGAYCLSCGPDMAKIALAMTTREFDAVEKRAAHKIADEIGSELSVPAVELPAFVLWVIEQFAENMRKDIEQGGSPF